MKNSEMIKKLQELPPDGELMIIDSFNGNGVPRTINLGPVEHVVTELEESICDDNENLTGKTVYIIGYGCY